MRIISGQLKGRRLKTPKGREVRPTADRVKEALFNILPRDLSGRRVLDLFAGTGNLSLEAMSRGAERAVLVDIAREATELIVENLKAVGFAGKARVVTGSAFKTARALARSGERFDLIFLDPPYEIGLAGEALKEIAKESLLREDGVAVAEHSVREKVEDRYGPLARTDQRRYGGTVLSFFRHDKESPAE